jgi:predicted transcriptional regulator of viral defense system
MINMIRIIEEFKLHGGVLKTSELKKMGLTSRQIKRMVQEGTISKIKYGYYELTEYIPNDLVIVARLFPDSVIFLESALFYYGYIDRVPQEIQIAVDRSSKTTKYDIEYPMVKPFYMEPRFLEVGVEAIEIDGVKIRIFNRDRTMCDVLRFEKKMDYEVFSSAIESYIKDPNKVVRNLFEFAEILNIRNKVQTYIGVRL